MRRTWPVKLRPPTPPSFALPRPALETRLGDALGRRLTCVVAGAGFGKSTLVGSWAGGHDAAWYTLDASDAALDALARGIADALSVRVPPLGDLAQAMEGSRTPKDEAEERSRAQTLASLLCDALQRELAEDLVLVLDDLHEIGNAPGSSALIEAICRQAPPELHVVAVSRTDPGFPIERLRGQGQVLEIGGPELVFTADEVAALLERDVGGRATSLAPRLRDATGGWPAAVHLAIEALSAVPEDDREAVLGRLGGASGPLFAYLAKEVFDAEPPAVRNLVRTGAYLDGFTADLCGALGLDKSGVILASLARRGLFLEPAGPGSEWFSLGGLFRDFVRDYVPLSPPEEEHIHRRCARWLEAHGHTEEALRSAAAVADPAELARLLRAHGPALVRKGAVDAVIEAAERLPAEQRDRAVDSLAGQAHQVRGNWEEALACYRRATAGAQELPAALAWRMGLIHHMLGQIDEALAVYERGALGGEGADDALLLAWRATAHWLRNDAEGCREFVTRARELATPTGDAQALAAVHTTLAMLAALDGDRRANAEHYARALTEAEKARDVLQMIRIRNNRASHLVEEGFYEEGLAELEVAVGLADRAGFGGFLAHSLTNRGEARFRLGYTEEAIADLEQAKSIYQRIGSNLVCYPLGGLGDIYRERGDLALARAAYEEALDLADRSGNMQGLVPALCGLALTLIDEEPEESERLAERALACAPGVSHAPAFIAAASVALRRGDRERARGLAEQGAAAARSRRDRAALAECLVLEALAAPDPRAETGRVEEAINIWRDLRCPLGEAKAELELARLQGGAAARALAERAERRFRPLGARGHASAAAALIASLDEGAQAPAAIYSLGGFRVVRSGEPVPLSAWQSKRARDILKMLVARRGKPSPREVLMEALWPGEDPGKVANRLSVALTTVRSVLDPEKGFDAEHFVTADRDSVALDPENVWVDVYAFLDEASAGMSLLRMDRRAEAVEVLRAAEAAYTGDFLEEDPYEDWAVALREEARSAYIRVARALAHEAAASGDHDTAARCCLRVLERDPYDEDAHMGLVSTLQAGGRHGEARRYYRAYTARMTEIGVEAAPYPNSPTRTRGSAPPH